MRKMKTFPNGIFRDTISVGACLLAFVSLSGWGMAEARAEAVWTQVGTPNYDWTAENVVLSGTFASLQVFNPSGKELVFNTDFKYGSAGEDLAKLNDLNKSTKMCLTGSMSSSVKNNLLNDGSKTVLTFNADQSDWRSRLPLTKYSITTANDGPERDPDDWVLYGSNDGTEWMPISSMTDAALPDTRFCQFDFPLNEASASVFKQLKFEFTGNARDNAIFQMADVVFWTASSESVPDFSSKPELGRNYVNLTVTGTNVWKDGELASNWYWGVNETAENLLDKKLKTESQNKACIVADSGNFFDNFDSVAFDFQNKHVKNAVTNGILDIPETVQKSELTAYSLTTANDQPNRTPDDWVLYGSNDNRNWTVLDSVEGGNLPKTDTMYTIPLPESVPSMNFYRLEVTDSYGKIQAMQLSEFTLWDTPSSEEIAKMPAAKNITVAARGELYSNDFESAAKLQDGRSDKYLGYFNKAQQSNAELQLSEDSPLSITLEMDDLYQLGAYSFTSANDRVGRDPTDWQVYGSNNGEEWYLLDEVYDFKMTDERYATHQFYLDSEEWYDFFRFDFLGTKGLENGFQMAELTLYGTQIPEPSTIILLALGTLGLFSARRLRKEA